MTLVFRSKQAQITIFIIAGVAALLILGFILYSKGSGAPEFRKLPESSALSKYVAECLKLHTEEGLLHLSQQSGFIFASQGGADQDFLQEEEGREYVNYKLPGASTDRKVPYLIQRKGVETDQNYPWETFPYTRAIGGEKTYLSGSGISWTKYLRNKLPYERELEKKFEHYVQKKMQEGNCPNFERDIKEFKVELSEPQIIKTNITIAEDEIVAEVTMPLKATELSTGTRFSIDTFSATRKSRLRPLYEAARGIINSENSDIKYEPTSSEAITAATAEAHTGKDIIILTHRESGEKFVFSRQNRKPGLEWAAQMQLPGICSYDANSRRATCTSPAHYWYYAEITDTAGNCVRCQPECTGTYTISHGHFAGTEKAEEPDGQEIIYKYEMAGSTYTSQFPDRTEPCMTGSGTSTASKQFPVRQIAADNQQNDPQQDSQTITYNLLWTYRETGCRCR